MGLMASPILEAYKEMERQRFGAKPDAAEVLRDLSEQQRALVASDPSLQPRESAPNLLQRFADSFHAQPALYERVVGPMLAGNRFAGIRAAKEARAAQYPPQTTAEKAAGFLGAATKQVMDPIGIVGGLATRAPAAVAGVGAGYEVATDLLGEAVEGKKVTPRQLLTGAAAGATGALGGDAIGGALARGVRKPDSRLWRGALAEAADAVPERVGAGLASEAIEGEAAGAIDAGASGLANALRQPGRLAAPKPKPQYAWAPNRGRLTSSDYNDPLGG